MEFARAPRWDVSIPEAIRIQEELAHLLRLEDAVRSPELVLGLDIAAGRPGEPGRAAAVVWRRSDGAVVEQVVHEGAIRFPYVPGLLAFREGPLAEAALRRIRTEPDLVMVDGHGIAHPRRMGIAAHLGVLLDRPTIGVAKSRLFGRAEEPGPNPGDRAPLRAPDGTPIGAVLRTRAGSRPVYVSPGHRVSVERAPELVMACVRGHRLPEPTHLADRLSRERPG